MELPLWRGRHPPAWLCVCPQISASLTTCLLCKLGLSLASQTS